MSRWDDAKNALTKAIHGRFDVLNFHEAEKRAFVYMSELRRDGLEIVPAGDVLTPGERAAVGRIAELEQARQTMTAAAGPDIPMDDPKFKRACLRYERLRAAIQPGDIEAAQRVAEGGGNDS